MGGLIVSGFGSMVVAAILMHMFCTNKPGTIAYNVIWQMLGAFALAPLVGWIAGGEMRWLSALASLLIVGVAFSSVWQYVSLHLRLMRYVESKLPQDGAELIVLLLELIRIYNTVHIVVRVVDKHTLSVRIDKNVFTVAQQGRALAVVTVLQLRCDAINSATPVDVGRATRLIQELAIASDLYGVSLAMTSVLEA